MTHPSDITELRTRDRSSAFDVLVDHHTQLFRDLRAALPPKQAEAVEAIMCGPFYDGPQSPRRQRKPRVRPADGLRTKAEAAAKLGCSIKTLNGYVEAGELRYFIKGHGKKCPHKMFAPADIDTLIANRTREESPPCPSTKTKTVARRTSTTTSGCEVIGFTARRNARRAAKPKP